MALTFSLRKPLNVINLSNILKFIDLPCLINEQKDFCEIELGGKNYVSL